MMLRLTQKRREKIALGHSHAQHTGSVTTQRLLSDGAIIGELHCDSLTVTDTIERAPVENGSTEAAIVDTTGATADSFPTVQAAIDYLATKSADVACIKLIDGQTVALTANVYTAAAQLAYRAVQIRGGRTEVLRDTVASVAVGGPGSTTFGGVKVWILPTLTSATPAVGALDNLCVYNETIDNYFAMRSTDGTGEVTTCSMKAQSGLASYGPNAREPWAIGDVFVAYTPSATLRIDAPLEFGMIDGHKIEFRELNLEISDTASVHAEGSAFVLRGCDVYARNTQLEGSITCPIFATGCTFHVDNEDNFIYTTTEFERGSDVRRVFRNCSFYGGGQTASVLRIGPSRQEFYGCSMDVKTIGVNITGLFFFYMSGCWCTSTAADRNEFAFGIATSKNSVFSMKACTVESTVQKTISIVGIAASFIVSEFVGYRFDALNAAVDFFLSEITGVSAANVVALREDSSLIISTAPMNISNDAGVGLSIESGSSVSVAPGFSGTCSTYAVYLTGGGSITGTGITATGGTADCRLGAAGDKSWATIATGAAATDRNDYTVVGSENCAAYVT